MLQKIFKIIGLEKQTENLISHLSNKILDIVPFINYSEERLQLILEYYNKQKKIIEVASSLNSTFFLNLDSGLIEHHYKSIQCDEIINRNLSVFFDYITNFNSFLNIHQNTIKNYNNISFSEFKTYMFEYVYFRRNNLMIDEIGYFSNFWNNYIYPDISGMIDEKIRLFFNEQKQEIFKHFIDYYFLENLNNFETIEIALKQLEKNKNIYYKFFNAQNKNIQDILYDFETELFGKEQQQQSIEDLMNYLNSIKK